MRRLLVSVCLAALASCSAPAPHGDGGASPDAASSTIDGATGDAGPTCGEGELYCEGSCRSLAELAEDPDNCGACGARCGNVCREGSCREVVSISAGPTTTCAALSDGSVWCWGSNVSGELGMPELTRDRISSPATYPSITSAIAVAAGGYHACALLAAGTVTCWGRLSEALGPSATQDPSPPVDVPGLSGVVEISAGDIHTCARTDDGRVSCWGTNGAGSLGDGTTTPRASPAPVPGVTSARQVVASNAGTCIDHDGGLVCFGEQHRIFGLPTDDDVLELRPVTNIPRPILDLDFTGHLCAGTSGGEVYCTGQSGSQQSGTTTAIDYVAMQHVEGLGDVVDIATSSSSSCAVTRAGEVSCWGDNSLGQLGNGDHPTGGLSQYVQELGDTVVAVAAGGAHFCALLRGGAMACWGWNSWGQVADPTESPIVDVPRRVRF